MADRTAEGGLSRDEAEAIFEVLVTWAGESEDADSRADFVFHQTKDFCPEYRFIGALGFGGKFRRRHYDDAWYVDAYSEDLTPKRRLIIEQTNAALAETRRRLS